jgi:glycosyltransferase involved in cell wall biosynthesis/UDP-2,3-diacylglucosamine pyrophosphatase LpxH
VRSQAGAWERERGRTGPSPYGTEGAVIQPRIALLTGTFGQEEQNGVGRFLAGLHKYSAGQSYPLAVFAAGDHLRNYPGVHNLHALTFPLPQFEAVHLYYPLEGRRRQLRRAVREVAPDLLHLSTPDAIGVTGLSIAKRLGCPVAAVYHTDFPAFGRQMVEQALERRVDRRQPLQALLALGGPALRQAFDEVVKHLTVVERFVLRRALRRNRKHLAGLLGRGGAWLADAARVVVQELMFQFYSQCHLVIARSDVYRKKLIEEVGLPEANVKALRAGVDTKTFSPEKTAADVGLRQRLGIPEAARVVLYVGRVTDEKNVQFLADAWRQFREQGRAPEAVFVVVGSGQPQEFQARAGRDVLTLGPRHGAELSAIYRTADVFWTASTTETLGQVILEAQASGGPVIVADQGASPENVTHEATGLVLPVDRPERWAAALRQLLEDRPHLRQLAGAARRSAEGRSIEHSYEHYWELHRELHEREAERHKYAVCGRLHVRVPASLPPLNGDAAAVRTTHVGDFHAGHGARPQHKERAVRIIAERARARNAEVYLHGDFSDTRPRLKKMLTELEMFRRTFAEVGVVPRAYVEGNHDYEFARAGRLAELVGCPVEPSLVAVLPGGLVITHGHVSELRELPDILRACRTVPEITAALAVDRLHARLKQSAFEYDLTGVAQHWAEQAGLDGLEDWWRHILPQRRRLADTVLGVAVQRGLDYRALDALGHMAGSQNREQVLARLCTALGGWGLVYGHTHDPHLTVIDVLQADGGSRPVLVGNAGSMRRKRLPPTWIETQGRTMELYAYDKGTDREVLVDRVSLGPSA